jgi:hypothetical protein
MKRLLKNPFVAGLSIVLLLFLLTCVYAQNPPDEPSYNDSDISYIYPKRLLVKFKDKVSSKRVDEILNETKTKVKEKIQGIDVHILELPENANEKAFENVFKRFLEVDFAEVDRILPPSSVTPNDPGYINQWHLKRIQSDYAWDYTKGSNTVIVAILDTGVDINHPDLTNKLTRGWNVYNNNSDVSDVYGHGTAVAGTVAASTNNLLGVASIAWDCLIMPIRISDPQGYATYSDAAKGLIWAADNWARVANISYRMSESSTVASAAKYFQDKGGVVTISAGNQSTFISNGDNPYVLTVSATTSSDTLATFSNTGNIIDVSAPGVSIYTTIMPTSGSYYGSKSGTSFSAPIVAGVAALVISANPSLTARQVSDIILNSADDLGDPGWDPLYGYGRVNAKRAVETALNISNLDTTPPSITIVSPKDNDTLSGTIFVEVNAIDNVRVSSVSLYIDGQLRQTLYSAPYNFSWDTTKELNGLYSLMVVARDESGNISSQSIIVNVYNQKDTTPPTIEIVSPKNGDLIRNNVTVYVNAYDNIGVTKVELYVDGRFVTSSVTAPFTLKWNSRNASKGPHTIQCKAYDSSGNVGYSQEVTVYK